MCDVEENTCDVEESTCDFEESTCDVGKSTCDVEVKVVQLFKRLTQIFRDGLLAYQQYCLILICCLVFDGYFLYLISDDSNRNEIN